MKTFTKRILLLASILLIWDITAKHVNPLFIPEPVTVFDDLIGIDQNGLIPKSRLYVHLSKDVETAKAVGKRHGKEVVYSINSEQMYKDGYKFYLSKNGVWLTKRVPVKYVMKEV